jgi:hypothetical protein
MNEQDRIDMFYSAYPDEVHVNGRFFYEPRMKRFWHWCEQVSRVGLTRTCNRRIRVDGRDVIVCSQCNAEIQESEFPAALQLYLKLF